MYSAKTIKIQYLRNLILLALSIQRMNVNDAHYMHPAQFEMYIYSNFGMILLTVLKYMDSCLILNLNTSSQSKIRILCWALEGFDYAELFLLEYSLWSVLLRISLKVPIITTLLSSYFRSIWAIRLIIIDFPWAGGILEMILW